MHGSSGIIKNFCTNRVIGLLILPLVCTGSHREFPSHGRFFTDGRFPSCMFCQTRVILFMEMCTTLPTPFSMLCTIADASPTPHGDGNSTIMRLDHVDVFDASPTPHGDGNFTAHRKYFRSLIDASPTPHGDGNDLWPKGSSAARRCIPYPSRGRKP